MTSQTAQLMTLAIMLGFCMAVFGTTAYAVFWLGYSGWWFLLAFAVVGVGDELGR